MNIGFRCKSEPFIFVWNPQTDISKYAPQFVKAYVAYAFPSKFDEQTYSYDAAVRIIVNSLGNCSVIPWRSRSELVYVQNRSDWHFNVHMTPFLASLDAMPRGKGFYSEKSRAAVYVGEWGEGHVAPPRGLISEVLVMGAAGRTSAEVLDRLSLL